MVRQRPQVPANAHKGIAGGKETVRVVSLNKILQRTAGEFFVTHQAHAVDDSLGLAFQGTVPVRTAPGYYALRFRLVTCRHQAVDLACVNDILQQWFGDVYLQCRRHHRVPIGPGGVIQACGVREGNAVLTRSVPAGQV
ncbi:MAG: hypothetical protein BWY09_00911 [Candidatus Hydrogenedentes bacterium ADurb.Bin179]|nr:MAG: hypothetical protein BWY09_00911 [Candidatus Hydrogenedentes bacterium ADurb.Bin179]